MALVELNVYQRQAVGKNANRQLRAAGRIPAVIYGNNKKTSSIELDSLEITRLLASAAGSSVIFALKQEGSDEDVIALLREIQRNPVNDRVLHVDLFEIPRGKPITTPVRIELTGESLAVKRGDANMSVLLDQVEISCLPRELPDAITFDISELDLGDRVYVKDLTTPVGEITSDPETLILLLKAPTIFVEEVPESVEGEEAAAEGAKAPSEGEREAAADAASATKDKEKES